MSKRIIAKYGFIVGTAALYSSVTHADDLSLQPDSSNMLSMILWFCMVAGAVAGWFYRQHLHRHLRSHENIKGGIVAIVVALTIAFLPYPIGGYGQFSKSCLTTITDNQGVIRQEVALAEECVIAREEVSALAIKPVISAYKSSFGYVSSDQYLSTAGVIFFYGLMLALWTTLLYGLVVLVNKFAR